MANSIRSKLDKNDTISEIKLLLAQNKNKVCAIVEGEDDQKLFSYLLSDNVDVMLSYNSKNGIDDIFANHFISECRVIGIRDKDYQINPVSVNVFYCDYSCAEMMIIAIDECFMRLHKNFYKGKLSCLDLRKACLFELEMFSNLRKLSEINNWRVRFDGIKFGDFFDNNTNKLDYTKIFKKLNIQNKNNEIDSSRFAILNSIKPCNNMENLLCITNGHDFINILSQFCDKCKKDSISIALRTSFGKSEFKNTNLYTNLYAYQNQNNLVIVD